MREKEYIDVLKHNNKFQVLLHLERYKRVLKIKELNLSKQILDLGCGTGYCAALLSAIAMDIDIDGLRIAKTRYPLLDVILADAHHLPFRSQIFDLVYSLEVLEHLRDPMRVLLGMYHCLKNNGIIYLSTPNRSLAQLRSFIRRLKNISPPRHIREYDTKTLKKELRKAGFSAIKISGGSIWLPSILPKALLHSCVLLSPRLFPPFINYILLVEGKKKS